MLANANQERRPGDLLSSPSSSDSPVAGGRLIINADDWGRDRETTRMTFNCVHRGTVSSVSAMVFMEDSERAAALAQEHGVDTGLHINLTTGLSARSIPQNLIDHQRRISAYLSRGAWATAVFNPFLNRSFEYVVRAQIDEYSRLYGAPPKRIDGHHHVHLCSNVLMRGLLPAGISVRRYFSFEAGQDIRNRLFRRITDTVVTRRYRTVDFLFSLPPVTSGERLRRIFALATQYAVEVETHPANPDEYRFLVGDEILAWTEPRPIARCFVDPN